MVRNDVPVRVGQAQRPAPRPLLPPSGRPTAVAVLAGCVAITAFLGVLFFHHTQPGWLDTGIDARLRTFGLAHPALLNRISLLGSPGPVVAAGVVLALACLLMRHWRGAALVAIAVPTAPVLTEHVLKPLVDRILRNYQSFPSGHTTGAFVIAAVLAVLLISPPPRPWLPAAARMLAALAALLAAIATALAMVGLGAHYFTDTVGGAAVAIAVVLATALILDKLGSSRHSAL
jgi:membrane-associated phospholipid phosphatase